MKGIGTNKRKIINDPVHGFIGISSDLIFDLISHSFFQRLRRIRQLGMTHLVYPGATHTRFQHSIGAMHLMKMAVEAIRARNHRISESEEEAALIAILLHDIGHGPFSHTLESSLISEFSHEMMSGLIIDELNVQFDGRLELAKAIFSDNYSKRFLHQLVAGQLDMDRMDYLKRDSFYTGVNEGVIGSDRIIKMFDVVDDKLVVEAKGVYSIENFLIARRLMYWQVYFHKTVVAAEILLTMILKRARYLVLNGEKLFASPALQFFLKNRSESEWTRIRDGQDVDGELLSNFVKLDDDDVLCAVKVWADNSDKIISTLSRWFINRDLYRVEFSEKPFADESEKQMKHLVGSRLDIEAGETDYFVHAGTISNYAYNSDAGRIRILFNDGIHTELSLVSDILNVHGLSKTVKKYFLCYPKVVGKKETGFLKE